VLVIGNNPISLGHTGRLGACDRKRPASLRSLLQRIAPDMGFRAFWAIVLANDPLRRRIEVVWALVIENDPAGRRE
jgi:hypothetical protein